MNQHTSKPRLAVIGSANVDVIMRVERAPRQGETVTGGRLSTAQGGKGANQAVALARLGADVRFVARVGKDPFAALALECVREAGISLEDVLQDPEHPTGTALITVDARGDNGIAVDYGANLHLRPADARAVLEAVRDFAVISLQCEISEATNLEIARVAARAGVPVVLNPASILPRSLELLTTVYLITPNLAEACQLSAMHGAPIDPGLARFEQASQAAHALVERGVKRVVVTLGELGSLYVSPDAELASGVYPTTQVDATGAGDSFTAAMAYGIATRMTIEDSVRFASAVAASAVSRLGAQPSFPTMQEVRQIMRERAPTPPALG